MQHKTIIATAAVATAALLALAAPASGAPKPRANPQDQTTFAVPARVLPGGIAPGTPRPDWDVCDQPGSLYLDLSFIPRSLNVYPQWNTFGYTSVRAAAVAGYYYNPAAPANPSQPWPAYVSCAVSGLVTVPTGHTSVRLSVTMTDISNQPVRVAYVTDPKSELGPSVNYSTWAHAHWILLRPGKSTQFDAPPFVRSHRYFPIPGFWLVRPTVPPLGVQGAALNAQQRWPYFTEWIHAFQHTWIYLDASRPTGQCSATLVSGTVSGIASAPDSGYWVLSSTGEISGCGAPAYGDAETAASISNVEDAGTSQGQGGESIAAPPDATGFWVEASGAAIPFGDARFHGQDDAFLGLAVRGTGPNASAVSPAVPAFVSMASMPSGHGYWVLSAYGHAYPYKAPYYGSANFAGAIMCRAAGDRPCSPTQQGNPVLTPHAAAGMAPTDGGKGYVIVARDGRTARFGKAPTCSLPAGVSVVGVAADYRTGGYWVATTHGQVYACQAPNWPFKAVAGTVAGIAGLDNGLGYRLVTTNGKVYDYGAAVWHGDPN